MGGGTYCFWCGSRRRRRPRCSLSSLSWTNGWILTKLAQTHYWKGGKKWFWWHWPYFQGHTSTLKFSNFDPKSLSAPYLLNQMTDSGQTSYFVTLGWFKDMIRFWWPWPNCQGHHTINIVKFSNFDQKMLVCTLSLEPNDGFWPNFIYCNVGIV